MNPEQRSLYTYEDEQGTLYLPFDEALEIAQRSFGTEPQAVLIKIEASEGNIFVQPNPERSQQATARKTALPARPSWIAFRNLPGWAVLTSNRPTARDLCVPGFSANCR